MIQKLKFFFKKGGNVLLIGFAKPHFFVEINSAWEKIKADLSFHKTSPHPGIVFNSIAKLFFYIYYALDIPFGGK